VSPDVVAFHHGRALTGEWTLRTLFHAYRVRVDPFAERPDEAWATLSAVRALAFEARWSDPTLLGLLEAIRQRVTDRSAPFTPLGLNGEVHDATALDGILGALEGAARAGSLRIEEIEVHSGARRSAMPPAEPQEPEPARGPRPIRKATTWFEVTFVDEVRQAIGGLEVAFSYSGQGVSRTTDGAGTARLDGVTARSAEASVADVAALRDALKPRWDQVRQGDVVTSRDGVDVVHLRGDELAPVKLDHEKPKTVSVQPYVVQARLLGMFFDTNKNFLLPTAISAVRKVKRLYDDNPGSKLLVVGHTDTSGQAGYNDKLSLERADSVAQYLTDDVDGWLTRYGQGVAEKKRWGSAEDLMMIEALRSQRADLSTYVGGTQTAPVRWYQGWHNGLPAGQRAANWDELAEDGIIGPHTRRQLVGDYMNFDDTSLPADVEMVTHGCGENFPLDETGQGIEGDAPQGEHDQLDRRVELFFFDGRLGVQPPPPGKNSGPGSGEYPEWRRRSTIVHVWTPGEIPTPGDVPYSVRITDEVGEPLGGLPISFRLGGGEVETTTDDDGYALVYAPEVDTGMVSARRDDVTIALDERDPSATRGQPWPEPSEAHVVGPLELGEGVAVTPNEERHVVVVVRTHLAHSVLGTPWKDLSVQEPGPWRLEQGETTRLGVLGHGAGASVDVLEGGRVQWVAASTDAVHDDLLQERWQNVWKFLGSIPLTLPGDDGPEGPGEDPPDEAEIASLLGDVPFDDVDEVHGDAPSGTPAFEDA
jgi:outer membrane protein OmpA-like peptidoglycan-associated protein